MSSLYNKEKNTISGIKKQNWKDIIIEVYNDNFKKYNFNLNSELIDLENKFKIVRYKEKNYVIKRTTIEKGKLEVKNSKKMITLLGNNKINGINIIVLIPKLVIVGNNSYLITEYKGTTMQEKLYTGTKNKELSYKNFIKINDYLINKGILYRGFIPRNIILHTKKIYMIDFEDVIIYENKKNISYDMLFATNFILNWQYFYKRKKLEKYIKKLKIPYAEKQELLKYEERYKKINETKNNILTIRNKIKNTVINSEKPSKYINYKNYEIMPNDLAHLISDLFDYNYDVLFDVISEKIRHKNEKIFYMYLKIFSNIILQFIDNKEEIIFYILIVFSMYIEAYIDDKKIFNIEDDFRVDELIEKIEKSDFELAKAILKYDYYNIEKTFNKKMTKFSKNKWLENIDIKKEIIELAIKIIKTKEGKR